MRYYIADNHFYHSRLNDNMDKRGFSSGEEMNQFMIDQWNSRVRKNDEVVILGDLSIGNAEETNKILEKLNGRLFLLQGNHDKWLWNKAANIYRFQSISGYTEMNDNRRKVILCHYPIMCYNGQFRRNADGNAKVWMLHGHVHNTPDVTTIQAYKDFVKSFPRTSRNTDIPKPAPIQMINCFCMYSNYIPWTLDEWIEFENSGKKMELINKGWKYDDIV